MILYLHLKAPQTFFQTTFLKVTRIIILSFATQQRTKQQEEKMDTNKIQTAAWSICPYDAVKSADMGSVSSAIWSQQSSTEQAIQTRSEYMLSNIQ